MKAGRIALLLVLIAGLFSCDQRTDKTEESIELAGVIIVASKSGNDVYFIDRESGETLVVLPTGLEPHEVEVSDDGRIAVVCNYGDRENPGNTLTVYDVQRGEYHKTIDLGEHTRPHGMQWVAGTNNLLVTTEGSNSLLIVDVKTGEIKKEMNTREEVSHMVAATPDFSRAFVPSIRTGNVAVFDLETGELIDHIYSGRGAEGIDVSPDGREVWITNRADNTITILDTQTLELLAQLPCEDFPIRAKFTPDGSRFLVSNARSGTIAVFDAINKLHMGDIKLTPPVMADTDAERYFAEFEGTSIPIGLVIPDNRFAYVANTRSDVVSVIDIENMEITGHFEAGREPDGINFSHLKPE
ncbi:MAG: YncE family protein [Bacteroidetes bacterium]|nr:MAG: YncE family protein [Bacteroidota bacterium]